MVASGFTGRTGGAALIGTLLNSRGARRRVPLSLPGANSEFIRAGASPARLSPDSNIGSTNITDDAEC